MKVILLERVERLGSIGDIVEVKNGYARNFLLPKSKALRATNDNIKLFESKKADISAANDKAKQEATLVADEISALSIVVVRQASESGFLFGSVTARDIVNELEQHGINGIKRQQIVIEHPIKVIGSHLVKIYVHPEVVVNLAIRVMIAQELGDSEEDIEAIHEGNSDFVELTAI